jgi:hypothetical protein
MLDTFLLSLSCFRLFSENLKIKIHKTIIQPFALYGCETWPLTLRKVHRLRVFENRVPRILQDEVAVGWEDCIMRSFIVCTLHQILFG